MDAADRYREEVDAWHAERIRRLLAPDGWLGLVGLEWLQPGSNTVGSAPDNAIVIASAPPHLGRIDWAPDGVLSITLAPGAAASVDGQEALQAELRDDTHPVPTVVAFGSASFSVIERSGRRGLRVRDTRAATRTRFAGIERFPVDPAWRIVAAWEPLDPPYQLATSTVIGTLEHHPAPGRAVFEHDGQRCELYPVLEAPGDDALFVIFADATSGRETYGAARFLYAEAPTDGRIVLDFNKSYNPPCAFTPYATCPLAPPENRLPVRVMAGELKPRGH